MSAVAPPPAGTLPSLPEVIGQASQENFTVASAFLGRRRQTDLMAIYGFARLVDDVGDEVAGDRGALLDRIETELEEIYRGGRTEHAVLCRLADTVGACSLPAAPFKRLIEANRHDQVVTRYQTFEQLLDYCQLSAAPVGELVLHVFGLATPERIELSDRICAGLQITEHLQDIAEDYGRGRVYLPCEDLIRFQCPEEELASPQSSQSYQALISFEVARARSLLSAGTPLARTLPLRPRIAVAGFVAGGRTALDELELAWRQSPGRPARRRGPAFALALLRAAVGR